ncbi:MAG: hypothetical protein H0U71_07960 [Gammaproteobacteria bacterium]|nr:hypothetical protein [Gammaproteobacteria bacterium]
MTSQVITYKSPDNIYNILLKLHYVTRTDRVIYKLSLNGSILIDRSFNDSAIWSVNSRYFAIQEWIEPCDIFDSLQAYSYNNSLTVFDFFQGRECQLIKLSGGNVVPRFFENSKIIYTKEIILGLIKEYEIDLEKLDRWKKSPLLLSS